MTDSQNRLSVRTESPPAIVVSERVIHCVADGWTWLADKRAFLSSPVR